MVREHSPRFLALVEDAKRRIREVTVAELKRRIEAGDHFHLLDVREVEEWAAGRIRGAQHLCKGVVERDIETLVPDLAAEIVLYCGGGYRSALVADNLQKMSYLRVSSLAGGWRAWRQAGFPIEK